MQPRVLLVFLDLPCVTGETQRAKHRDRVSPPHGRAAAKVPYGRSAQAHPSFPWVPFAFGRVYYILQLLNPVACSPQATGWTT